ncbi:MAG: hypothetical protein C5B49_09875, partial [Bdellovibrio sp.]
GEVGYGRLLDPDLLLQEVVAAASANSSLAPSSLSPSSQPRPSQPRTSSAARVLITLGGTSEPIDEVRSITNQSTGRTGVRIAEVLSELGFRVTCLCARLATRPSAVDEIREFSTYRELRELLRHELSANSYCAVIHAAAVSDYHVEEVLIGGVRVETASKIPSGAELTLRLASNEKIVNHLREWSSNKEINLVAFKMTQRAPLEERLTAVQQLVQQSSADFVVHNEFSELTSTVHPFMIFDQACKEIKKGTTKDELALSIGELLTELI